MFIRSCIFDLDGVIVDTPHYHYATWRQLANELGFDITETQNEQLKGVSRRECLDLILSWGNIKLTEQEIAQWLNQKNLWFIEMIDNMHQGDALPGVVDFITHLRDIGIHIALGSASRNAKIILGKLNIIHLFDCIIDGNDVANGKPDPETFLKAIEGFDIKPAEGIVFEDSIKGIEAAINGGFHVVGVGGSNSLQQADYHIMNFESISFSQLLQALHETKNHSKIDNYQPTA